MAPPRPISTTPHELAIGWSGRPWSLTGLSFINFVLTILTFGIYSFWGRTEVRQRIWSFVRIEGEPLEYTGTGKELFVGFMIVLFGVLLPTYVLTFVIQLAFGPRSWAAGLIQIVLFGGFFYLVAVALYRARRYRLSRTRWRAIHGALTGSSWTYGWTSIWTALLIPLTLGWIVPLRATMLQRRLTKDMSFGDRRFHFHGGSGPLYVRYVVRWFAVIVLLAVTATALYLSLGDWFAKVAQAAETDRPPPMMRGREIGSLVAILLAAFFVYSIITAWYRASQANLFAAATFYAGARFSLNVTAGGLIWLFVTNFLITALSLSILRPVAEARAAQYFIERLKLVGPIDVARIAQGAAAHGNTGEGLAQAFDVDAF